MNENLLQSIFHAIIWTIVAELKSKKLLDGYSNMGIDVSMFEPDLYRVVFLLAGIKTERQYSDLKEWYDKQLEQITAIEITDTEKINEIAGEILIGLMERRKHLKP